MQKPKSNIVKSLDAIQAAVHSFLKPLGFRKKGRTHNRCTDGGLIHVVNFQMGQYPIGDYVIPGLRESYYGRFAVNLGVLLPCVYEAEWQRPMADFVQESSCTIRRRLGSLAFGEDRWFDVTNDTPALATTIVGLLDQFGLDFLDQFQLYCDVLSYYNAHGDLPFQNHHRASLEAALIAHHIGDTTLARSLFTKALSSSHKGFQAYAADIVKRVGYEEK
jgi:hypothetical protein